MNSDLNPTIGALTKKKVSVIYDQQGNEVRKLGVPDTLDAEFSDLPDVFIYALLSVEDRRFFVHDGVDIQRLIASAINNIQQMRFAEGASTLTQQLMKNKKLTSAKTLPRKVQEIILALRLEEELSKEEIFLLYVNQILFDGVQPGINQAARKFFSKTVKELTLPEAALLVAMVKSPTLYHPINHPENAQARMELVLSQMYEAEFIDEATYLVAKQIKISSILNPFEFILTHQYQAYFDLVYQEVEEITGQSPFDVAFNIETYLDPTIQQQIDQYQSSSDFFLDEEQQIGGVVLDNNNRSIIGVIGGRNYQGERLFNRAFNMRQQPASTIKPVLSYALAFNHLTWTNEHVVKDEEYFYQGTTKEVRNADRIHMGELTIEQALGYSRNTCALSTLDQVIAKIGRQGVVNYLNQVNLMDVEDSLFNMAYGIGAFNYGVSPLQLAEAYQVLARGGVYQKGTTIKKITDQETGQVWVPNYAAQSVISEEAAFLTSTALSGVVAKNYWGSGSLKGNKNYLAAKTGTSSFDQNQLGDLNYPSDASKDLWLAGYNKDYTITLWTGFDQFIKNGNTYFAGGDPRRSLSRKIFAELWSALPADQPIPVPDSMEQRLIVKGLYPYVAAGTEIDSMFTTLSYFPKGTILATELPEPTFPDLGTPQIMLTNQLLEIVFDWPSTITNSFYGLLSYTIEITFPDGSIEKIRGNNPTFSYYLFIPGLYHIKTYFTYSNSSATSPAFETDIVL